jgi:hypothetical protein
MRTPLIAAVLLFSGGLLAQTIIVFAKGDTLALGPGTDSVKFENPEKDSLLTVFKSDLALGPKFENSLELSNLPQWGRKVPDAKGTIQFHNSFHGGIILRVELGGLRPNHKYILTLNGNPERVGNNSLVDPVPGNEKE